MLFIQREFQTILMVITPQKQRMLIQTTKINCQILRQLIRKLPMVPVQLLMIGKVLLLDLPAENTD